MAAPQGNQYAKKAKLWEQAIKRCLASLADGASSLDAGLDKLAMKLVKAAEAGDSWALLEIGNRMDGKPAQAVSVTGEDGGPVQYEKIVREVMGAHTQDPDR